MTADRGEIFFSSGGVKMPHRKSHSRPAGKEKAASIAAEAYISLCVKREKLVEAAGITLPDKSIA